MKSAYEIKQMRALIFAFEVAASDSPPRLRSAKADTVAACLSRGETRLIKILRASAQRLRLSSLSTVRAASWYAASAETVETTMGCTSSCINAESRS